MVAPLLSVKETTFYTSEFVLKSVSELDYNKYSYKIRSKWTKTKLYRVKRRKRFRILKPPLNYLPIKKGEQTQQTMQK